MSKLVNIFEKDMYRALETAIRHNTKGYDVYYYRDITTDFRQIHNWAIYDMIKKRDLLYSYIEGNVYAELKDSHTEFSLKRTKAPNTKKGFGELMTILKMRTYLEHLVY